MISSDNKFIFVHVPKTGGNTVHSVLLPLSDDQKVLTGPHQDGTDRFEVRGSITAHKHMPLSDYAQILGGKIDGYSIITTIRHPFERMVSFYFSPHLWHQKIPFWSRSNFIQLVDKLPSTTDFLKINGIIKKPDFLLRFENLQTDLNDLIQTLSLPIAIDNFPQLNASAGTRQMRDDILEDHDLRQYVEQRHHDDLALWQASRTQN